LGARFSRTEEGLLSSDQEFEVLRYSVEDDKKEMNMITIIKMTLWQRIRISAVLSSLLLAGTAFGQTKTLTGKTEVVTGTVEAIQADTRIITVKGPKGNYVDMEVPKESKKFDNLKVGDKVTARYYENLILRLKAPGEPEPDTAKEAVTPSLGSKPGGTYAKQRTITAVIDAIDPKVPSISFKGPNGWAYSSRVADKKALSKVKVGDRVEMTWTAALMVSME